MAAVAAVAICASSCAIRFDKKKILAELSGIEVINPSDVQVRKDTAVGRFNALVCRGNVEVKLVQDDVPDNVNITAPDNVMPYIKADVEDGILNIRCDTKDKVYTGSCDITVTVHSPSLRSLDIVGSSEFSCGSLNIPGDTLSVSLSGSGEADFGMLASAAVKISVAGSAELGIESAETGRIDVSVAGSGEVDIDGIRADEVNAEVAGSGSVELNGTAGTASLSVAGSGEVDAEKLKCPSVSAEVRGSGSISYQGPDGRIKSSTSK